jgi:hypothetical protein
MKAIEGDVPVPVRQSQLRDAGSSRLRPFPSRRSSRRARCRCQRRSPQSLRTKPTIYSALLLADAGAVYQRGRRSRRDWGPLPSAMRPCVPGSGNGGTHGRAGADGEGRSGVLTVPRSSVPTVLRPCLAADLSFQAADSLAPQVVEPTAERASCTQSAASSPPAASISPIICTGTMHSPINCARSRGHDKMVTFLQ